MHRSYGLQGSLKRRYKHPSPTSINGYHTAKKLLSQSPAKRPTFAFADESGYTLAFANRIAHSGSQGETGGVSDGGWYLYPRSVSHGSETLRGQVSERQTLPLLGLGRGCSQRTQRAFGTAMRMMRVAVPRRRSPAGLRDPVVRPLMLRFSVSVRKASALSPANATRSSSHLNPSTTRPSSKNRTQRLTRRNVCALDVAILEVSCYTDGHRKPLKNFFIFFENRVRNGAARASI